jgi:hypothetical protein
MMAAGFDLTPPTTGEMPECLKTPRLLDGGKTFILLCRTLPGKSYAVAINAKAAGGFANLAGARAWPASLTFTTTADDPVRDLEGALKAANLDAHDMPVQETPGLPGGS